MNQIKPKKIIEELALEMGLPVEHVDIIISSYYKDVQMLIKNLVDIRVTLTGIGTFTIVPRRLLKMIEKTEATLDKYHDDTTIRGFEIRRICKEQLDNMYKLKQKLKDEKDYKQKKKKERFDEYIKFMERKRENYRRTT